MVAFVVAAAAATAAVVVVVVVVVVINADAVGRMFFFVPFLFLATPSSRTSAHGFYCGRYEGGGLGVPRLHAHQQGRLGQLHPSRHHPSQTPQRTHAFARAPVSLLRYLYLYLLYQELSVYRAHAFARAPVSLLLYLYMYLLHLVKNCICYYFAGCSCGCSDNIRHVTANVVVVESVLNCCCSCTCSCCSYSRYVYTCVATAGKGKCKWK